MQTLWFGTYYYYYAIGFAFETSHSKLNWFLSQNETLDHTQFKEDFTFFGYTAVSHSQYFGVYHLDLCSVSTPKVSMNTGCEIYLIYDMLASAINII